MTSVFLLNNFNAFDSTMWLWSWFNCEVLLFGGFIGPPRSEISDIKEPFWHFLYFLSSKQTKTVTWEMISIILILTFVLCSEFLMCWRKNRRPRWRLQLQEQQDPIDGWLHLPYSITTSQHIYFFFYRIRETPAQPELSMFHWIKIRSPNHLISAITKWDKFHISPNRFL